MKTKFGMLHWTWVALVVLISDFYTKYLAESALQLGEQIQVLPILNWTLAYNTGMAWSIGSGNNWLFLIIASVVSLGISYWIYTMKSHERWMAVALSLVLGGAIGNLYDRITNIGVVDFIQFHWAGWYFPAFNIADSAITVGAVMLIIDSLFFNTAKKEAKHENNSN